MNRNESGQVTAFVVIMMTALFAVAGLVIDGGLLLAAKRNTINEAESAARAGAQGLDTSAYRTTGTVRLDSGTATRNAQSFIAATGDQGGVEITGDTVHVTMTHRQTMPILDIVGLGAVTVNGEGTARAVRGVEVPE